MRTDITVESAAMDPFAFQSDLFASDAYGQFGLSHQDRGVAYGNEGSSHISQSSESTVSGSIPATSFAQQSAPPIVTATNNMFQDDFLTTSSNSHHHFMISQEESSYIDSSTDKQLNATGEIVEPHGSDEVTSSNQEVETVAQHQLEIPDLEAMTSINNVVCSYSTRCHLNLKRVALEGSNVIFKRENNVSHF